MINSSNDGNLAASLEFEDRKDMLAARTKDLKTLQGSVVYLEELYNNTLYVTNYPASYDDRNLKEMFSRFGTIIDIRRPSLAFKQSRRFAYIEMLNPADATKALELDGHILEDESILSVQISNPEARRERSDPM